MLTAAGILRISRSSRRRHGSARPAQRRQVYLSRHAASLAKVFAHVPADAKPADKRHGASATC
jgi:hypothetical protein